MSGDKKWLVKSNDAVHGPFEFDRVVENIFNGEIHLLDEIKGPFERWRPIKDHSLFAAAIEKLKASTYAKRENTVTATVEIGTQTDKLTDSMTLSVTDGETLTPTEKVVDPAHDVNFSAGTMPQEIPVSAPQDMAPPVPSYPVQTKRRFPLVFIVSFLFFVVGGASYLVYEFKQTKLIEQKISAYDQLTDNAILYLNTGEYQKALKNFKLAYNISPKDPNLIIEMSPLSIQFDGQFNKTKLDVENLIASNKDKSFRRVAQNIIGLAQSYSEKYKQALASYESSLNHDENFLPALLNKAFVLMKLERNDEAIALMERVRKDNPDEAVAKYFSIRALVEKGLHSGDQKYLKEALSAANQYPQKFADFKQEVLFLVALTHFNLGYSQEQLVESVKSVLRVDLELTNLHVHDTLIDFQSFNWVDFIPHCRNLAVGLDDYHKKMLEAFCLLKVNRPIDAKKIFEGLLSQQNNDGILQALYASTQLKLNDLSQAKNALGFLNLVDQKQPVVETILRGCLAAGDLNCGQAIFRGRHAKHISLLYSHWGNSEIMYTKNRRKAKSSVVLGLQISPNFAPLLKIKRKFD